MYGTHSKIPKATTTTPFRAVSRVLAASGQAGFVNFQAAPAQVPLQAAPAWVWKHGEALDIKLPRHDVLAATAEKCICRVRGVIYRGQGCRIQGLGRLGQGSKPCL